MSLQDITRRVRQSLGLNQDELSAKLGVASSSIGNWETGAKRPSPKNLRKMADLAPGFADEIRRLIEQFEWHPTRQSGRYSSDTVAVLHQALDIILDRAPSEAVQKTTEVLEAFAGKWGDHPARARSLPGEPYIVPAEIDAEISRLAVERRELDTSLILLDVLRSGIHAEKLKIRGERQAESDREGQARVHRGKKAK